MDKNYEFTHLHVHTEYSLLDGSAKISELIARCKELGMDSIAITDHGAMFGVIDFYKEAKAQRIKPIIGCEVYVAAKSRFDKDSKGGNYFHLVLLAENEEGYRNLIKLVSYGYLEGFYYKPRIDLELLKKYHSGIIAGSACLAGPVSRAIVAEGYEKAKQVAIEYNDIFGNGNFFLELQDHGIEQQKFVNKQLIKIHDETGIPMICTNDSHYIYKEDSKPHDILLCVQTGKTINDENRMIYEGEQFYLKSPEEMYNLFPYAEEALKNTKRIAERCNVDFVFHDLKLPRFDVPDGKNSYEYLRELCYEGFKNKYGEENQELIGRLEYELSTIQSMGYVDYFLIVWDFIKFSKDNGISVGPGRGSAAGSIVSYCLDITTINPIKYDLIFERFLNPERVSMPDIDVDFCYERRQEVIDYVINKYGEDHVAQIITFGTLAARAAIKDVGRALAMPYANVDRISKMIPTELGITIDKALNINPELRKAYNEERETKYLIDMSRRLEGLPRHSSTHAAGVVICREPVLEYVPLSTNDGVVTTQYTMTLLEELGLLKMDFLGLRTLTIIQNTVKEVEKNYNIKLDIDNIDFDDKEVYDIISQGKTEGVFQLESAGMKSFMRDLQPTCVEDLIAGISLFRPGPMEFIPKYVAGKNNKGNIEYTHEYLEPILKTTYGCIVYQEQVMQIVRDLAGYSLGRSDIVRRAMSKKKASVMAEERKNFVYGIGDEVPGCVKNGIPAHIAEKIFDEMTDFAKYAFNKSHAACYAIVGYQTAWLKVHYTLEFMAALMTSVMDNKDKIIGYIQECKKMNIEIVSPDINKGFAEFSVSDGKILFGLAALKNVGKSAIQALVKERTENGPFKSLNDFCKRMDSGEFNKRAMESLIKCGAFDSLGGLRSQYMAVYKNIMDGISNSKKNNIEGQLNLFDIGVNDGDKFDTVSDELPNIKEFSMSELLAMEKDVLGIYVTGHPLAQYERRLKENSTCSSLELYESSDNNTGAQNLDGTSQTIGGMITSKSIKYTKTGKPMAFIELEDMTGAIEVVIFPESYEKHLKYIKEENVIVVSGKVQISDDQNPKIICSSIKHIDETESKKEFWVRLGDNDITINDITPILSQYRGDIPVFIYDYKKNIRFKADRKYWVDGSASLIGDVKNLIGSGNVIIKEK